MQKTSPPNLFSRKRIDAIQTRAYSKLNNDADFLIKVAAETISERLHATNRDFLVAVDLFSAFGGIRSELEATGKVQNLYKLGGQFEYSNHISRDETCTFAAAQREMLPLKNNSVNLITSLFGLHWSNDLPGTLLQIRKALVPDGLLMACLPGPATLNELHECMLEAEIQITGNAALRVGPFAEIRQVGGLLQRAGFALPVVDTEEFTVRYATIADLIKDLRFMGATSALNERHGLLPRNFIQVMEEIYRERYQDADGKLRVTVEIIYMSGWAPHSSQQKPLAPGSAKNQLKDFL